MVFLQSDRTIIPSFARPDNPAPKFSPACPPAPFPRPPRPRRPKRRRPCRVFRPLAGPSRPAFLPLFPQSLAGPSGPGLSSPVPSKPRRPFRAGLFAFFHSFPGFCPCPRRPCLTIRLQKSRMDLVLFLNNLRIKELVFSWIQAVVYCSFSSWRGRLTAPLPKRPTRR